MQFVRAIWLWVSFSILLLGLDQYLFIIGVAPAPKYFAFVWFGSALVLFAHGTKVTELINNRIVTWSMVYFAIATLWMPLAWNAYVAKEFTFVMITLILTCTSCFVLPQVEPRMIRAILRVCLVVAIASIVYDMMYPDVMITDQGLVDPDTVNISGRASGFYINPNASGLAVLMITICVVLLDSRRNSLFYMCLALVGILLTFSRGAIAGWLMAMFIFVLTNRMPRGTGLSMLVVVAIFYLFGESLIDYLYQLSLGSEEDWTDSLERLEFFLHGGLEDESGDTRMSAALLALKDILQLPPIGGGLGYSQSWTITNPDSVNTHNIFLKHALDFGLLGFLIFPYLLIAALFNSQNKTTQLESLMLIGMVFFFGLTSHNLMEQSFFILPLCIINHYNFYWCFEDEE